MRAVVALGLILLVFGICDVHCAFEHKKSVAVIGAGVGGSSAAFFLRQIFGDELQITVFEKDPTSGGRLQHYQFDGSDEAVELGGSIWHESNRFVHGFARKFNLTIRSMASDSDAHAGTLGIWNGHEFVFETSSWKALSLAKLFWRYGMSPIRLKSATNAILDRWMSIYDLLENRTESFENVADLLKRLELEDLTRETLSSHLVSRGCSQNFVDELITGITRVQYGQDAAKMHALVGLVSLVGAEEAKLYNAKEGNRKICENLLKASGATIHLSTTVKRIDRAHSSRYVVIDSSGAKTSVDAVIVATPLEVAQIDIEGFELPPPRPYQTTIATLIRASGLNGSYFGLPPGAEVPTEILTVENSSLPFSSLAVKQYLNDSSIVYKIFSRRALPAGLLDSLFINRTWSHTRNWLAYPVMNTPPRHAPFLLQKNLCYVNAFETAISAMETEALAARNCVNLVAKSLRQNEDGMQKCAGDSCE